MPKTHHQFGLVIAYLLPGFIALAGVAPVVPTVSNWLEPSTYAEASLGPPIYAILAAVTLGMIASCFRWLLVDQLHHRTGVTPPAWNDDRLAERLTAFDYLVESHYRYYQFVANSLVAVVWTYSVNRWMGTSPLLGLRTDVGAAILCIVLFAASRDALSKYYSRTSLLVGEVEAKGSVAIINANHHEAGGRATSKRPEVKSASTKRGQEKPQKPQSAK